MSSIGSGPGLGAGPHIEVNQARPISALSRIGSDGTRVIAPPPPPPPSATVPAPSTQAPEGPAPEGQAQATLVSTTSAAAGEPPVETDRVNAIRKAIQSGNYPLVPTKIADAMIAAGMILRISQ